MKISSNKKIFLKHYAVEWMMISERVLTCLLVCVSLYNLILEQIYTIMYTQTTLVCENVTTFEVCYCLQHTQTLPWSRTTKKNQNYENKKTPYAKKTNTSSIS